MHTPGNSSRNSNPKWPDPGQLHEGYIRAHPFPHIIIDDFIGHERLETVRKAFPAISDSQWINYFHYNEKKHGLNRIEAFPAFVRNLISELNSEDFVDWLSHLTGIEGLFSDPQLEGGGLHQSRRGGFLRIHSDFTSHPHHADWRRRVNVLIYLNKDWQESWGGHLELWTRDMQKCAVRISPVFDRCVIFHTDKTSFHGHPEPLDCPEDVTRKSIALYYYTRDHAVPSRATTYVARPEERSKQWRIMLDNLALRFYHRLKQTLGIGDGLISRVLGFFNPKKK